MAAAKFVDVNDYADAYTAMVFEGIPVPGPDTFDENTYFEMRMVQKLKLDTMFTVDARKLTFSRMLRKPLDHMKIKVQCQIGGKCETEDDLKYMIYSSHDD
jgi:hypothetical protein